MDIREEFRKLFPSFGVIEVVKAPGRVNVIGEHTDYNDGFVFPVAIDKYIAMAGSLRSDDLVKIYSLDLAESVEFDLKQISSVVDRPWASYPGGVIKLFQNQGFRLRGMNLAFRGNIPMGAGLSSSAALEMATAYMLIKLFGCDLNPLQVIQLCQQAENQFVGVNCGIMDQYISCLGRRGQGLLIDCRSLEARSVPILHPDLSLVIANTKVKHSLVESQYNQRRQECEEAVSWFQKLTGVVKKALRDVTIEELSQYASHLPEVIRQRAEHVISENQRVLAGVQALENNNMDLFGKLMNQSHQSLRDLYQVSCLELDQMVELAQQVDGVYGSRMTGGGFGGCTVSLVQTVHVPEFITLVGANYERITGIQPEFYLCDVVDGVAQATCI